MDNKIYAPELAGYVQIKRKRFWVIRYAQIINGIFYYFHNKGETTPRQIIKLCDCSIDEQSTSDGERIIFLNYKNQDSRKVLQITADSIKDHQVWFNRLKQYCSNNLTQSQVIQQQILLSPNPNQSSQILPNDQILDQQDNESENSSEASVPILNKTTSQPQFLSQLSPKQSDQKLLKSSTNQQLQNRFSTPLQLTKQQQQQTQPNQQQQQQQIQQTQIPSPLLQQSNTNITQISKNQSNAFEVDPSLLKIKQSLNSDSIQRLKANVELMLCEYKQDQQILTDADKDMQIYSHCAQSSQDQLNVQEEDLDFLQIIVEKFMKLGTSFFQHLERVYSKHSLIFVGYISFLLYTSFLVIYQLLRIVDNQSIVLSFLITINLIFLPYIFLKIKKYRKQNPYLQNFQFTLMQQNNDLQFKIQVKYLFPHNINEFLFIIQQDKVRKLWQPFTQSVQVQGDNSLLVTYNINNTTCQECFFSAAYKENNIIYFVEYTSLLRPLRIFKILVDCIDSNGCEIHYFLTDSCYQLHKMRNHNSPILLKALNVYLKTLKLSSKSILSEYYQTTQIQKPQGVVPFPNSFQQQQQQQQQQKPQPQRQQQQKLIDLTQPINNQQLYEQQIYQNEEIKEEDSQQQTQLSITQQKYMDIVERALQKLITLSNLNPANKWKELGKKGQYICHYKDDEITNQNYCRGEGPINASAKEVAEYLSDFEKRPQYDEMYKAGYKLEQITPDISISYNRFKGKLGVSDRDFAMVGGKIERNGKYYVLGTSVEHEKIPEVKGAVRGDLVIGGWVLEPTQDGKTHAIYILCSDPKGQLPDFVKSWATKLQSGVVQKVAELYDKWNKNK